MLAELVELAGFVADPDFESDLPSDFVSDLEADLVGGLGEFFSAGRLSVL